jgi:sensor histidine kinase YesM
MLRDLYLRLFFIPVLGIIVPMLSGIITYKYYTLPGVVGANLFFILVSLVIWSGSNWIHTRLRPLYKTGANAFFKMLTISCVSALYGTSIGGILTFLWLRFSKEAFYWDTIYRFSALTALAITVFTLLYEVLMLSKERELDNKIVGQLDYERSQAEMALLKNELDPHFIFNSLNTLSHLIVNNAEQAHLFNSRLAKVYKYFLVNKERELISLDDELEFMNNYFYLLQTRHDNKLRLITDLKEAHSGPIMILPCALQTLIENAIKHNDFSDERPLQIKITLNGQYIHISNSIRPKPYLVNSTGIGLKNLVARYKIVTNKAIIIKKNPENFVVSVPLIK